MTNFNMMMVTLVFLYCVLISGAFAEVGEDNAISVKDQRWLNSLFYLPDIPRIRKEYRMLSEADRNKLNGAFLKLKQDKTVSPNKYDLLVSLHARRSTRNSAHRGPGFLGWHRVFVLLMENALREKEPNITLSYWDSTIDSRLASPKDSCLWSEDFMGNGDGFVNIGVFKDWKTQADRLYRTVGIMYSPLEEKNISRIFRFHHIGNISYPNTAIKDSEDIFELTHNRVHRWIGGEMKLIETAADDPFFFIYHSFVSLVWEIFRGQQRLKGIDPEQDWDMFYGSERHHKYSAMGLGNLMAIDGSSEVFAENIVFEPRPSCSKTYPDCGSPYLYCNLTIEKCITWTIAEYSAIKERSNIENLSIEVKAKVFIEKKLKGVVDVLNHKENTIKYEVDEHEHDHNQDEGHSEVTDEYMSNDHGGHDKDHRHIHTDTHSTLTETHLYSGRHVGTFIERNLAMVLTAGTLLLFIIVSLISKCVEEKHRKPGSNKRRKYRMDGITNMNYADSERRKNIDKDEPAETRSDNIYTITVTSGTGTPSTFVRFAKYENHNDKQVGLCSSFSKETTDEGEGSTASSKRGEFSKETSNGDYLDMDYATRIINDAKSCDSDLYEISLESDCDDVGDDDFELETTYNSIENENFDTSCFHDNNAPCDQQCIDNATKSIDDVLADYDNLVFRTEASHIASMAKPPAELKDMSFDDVHSTDSSLVPQNLYM